MLVTGCLQTSSVPCGDGRVCPPGSVCDDTHGLCVRRDQVETCRGVADQTECTIGGVTAGVCSDEVCLPAGCGDKFATGLEQCDGDDMRDVTDCMDLGYYVNGPVSCTDGCSYDVLQCSRICGDLTRDAEFDEECDTMDLGGLTDCQQLGFYDPGPLRCNALCSFDRTVCTGFCGDGVVNGGEICDGSPPEERCIDFGYDAGPIACATGACGPSFASCARLGWRLDASPTSAMFSNMWASSPNDVWALGSSALFRYDGAAWVREMSPALPFLGIWGSGPDDVWLAGVSASIAHFDGTSWTTISHSLTGGFTSMWGSAPNDVYAVGALAGGGGRVARYDGATWSNAASSTLWPNLQAIWGFGPDDIWAVGASGAIVHRSSTGWVRLASTPSAQTLWGIWGADPNDVWAVGDNGTILHKDAAGWSLVTHDLTTSSLRAVRGTGPKDVWITGAGTLLHYDGVRWKRVTSPTPNTLHAVWPSAPDDVWAAGNLGTIARYPGAGWTQQLPEPTSNRLDSIAAAGAVPTSAWAVGVLGTVLRYDGMQWTTVTDSPVQSLEALVGVWARSDQEIWIGSKSGEVYRYDGTWTTFSDVSTFGIADIWGTATEVWVVAGTEVLRHDGMTWSTEQIPGGPTLATVWTTGPDDVWVGGVQGTIFHRTALGWIESTTPTTQHVASIWGSAPDDVWACGNNGMIIHYDGVSWTEMASGTTLPLSSIRGTGPDDVWAVGAGGVVIHWDGASWSHVRSSTANQLTDLVVTPRHVFAAGDHGTIDHLDRVSPWRGTCASIEAACGDSVDNDCDGGIDEQDADCP